MAQGVLPYKYEEEKNHTGMTAMAGLPIYLDLASVLGLGDCIRAHVHVREAIYVFSKSKLCPRPCSRPFRILEVVDLGSRDSLRSHWNVVIIFTVSWAYAYAPGFLSDYAL